MEESNTFESPVEPSFKPETTTPKAKRRWPMFPYNTPPILVAETSTQGCHQTRNMALPYKPMLKALA